MQLIDGWDATLMPLYQGQAPDMNIPIRELSLLLLFIPAFHVTSSPDQLDLPPQHRNIYQRRKRPFKAYGAEDKCWGYEPGCTKNNRLWYPECSEPCAKKWAATKEAQQDVFDRQADFGYILERQNEMTTICEPETKDDSSLVCAKYMRTCHATNIYIDLTNLHANVSTARYRENLFKEGDIGGYCKLDKDKLKREGQHKSPLQSWFAELESYSSLDTRPLMSGRCDVVLEKPTFVMKLDAGVNMYHHMCDFLNLYASQHMNGVFQKDINILMWDTSVFRYVDLFSDTWHAFTNNTVMPLKQFDGKKLCIKEAVFSLLPRMRFGMFYNMPLIPGCYGSGLFKAFSQYVLDRLGRKQEGPLKNKVRITLIERNTTCRNIINQAELVEALKRVDGYEVRVVEYSTKMPFTEQLQTTMNSDVLIGLHGAGLTHLLFQPDWAALVELYNCEDHHCYSDLARLRGVKYVTWQKKDKMTQEENGQQTTFADHPKFTNYAFDVEEFLRIIRIAANHVKRHSDFISAREHKYSQAKDEL